MKTCYIQIQNLFAILCIINASSAFVARAPCQLARIQRGSGVLFQEQTTIEKEELKTEESSAQMTEEPEEEMTETQKLMKQVKEAGTAGVISYALWELGFWALSVSSNLMQILYHGYICYKVFNIPLLETSLRFVFSIR